MKTACLTLIVLLLFAGAARAQGDIAGSARDRSGAVIPGVEIVASGGDARFEAVTDAAGAYRLRQLPAGGYTLTARLSGFVSRSHDAVVVANGRTTGPVDFLMCLGALEEILWVVEPHLESVWAKSDVVAHVRVAASGKVPDDECPQSDFQDTAHVLEVLKQDPTRPVDRTLAFVQPRWVGEPTPYAVGQELIVFLVRTPRGFERTGGPFWTFLINDDRITSYHSPMNTADLTPPAFLACLRAMAKSGSD